MITFLTSSIGGSYKKDGKWYPGLLLSTNGFIEQLKKYWKEHANVLVISSSPEEWERNDSFHSCLKTAFPMSGFSVNLFEICDSRNVGLADQINRFDVVILVGGHVPTQNKFFEQLGLKKLLEDYDGLVIAFSAGTMNCAEVVYALPELDGEGIDINYKRFMNGLGITKQMVIPHFQDANSETVDGMRVIEDIVYPDSMGREFLALNDGSYIINSNGTEVLFGEAYLIKNGCMEQICEQSKFVQIN